jgi:tetratricopeptide (TPR) repeat protein
VESGQVDVAKRFVDDLKQLRQRAGQPSYSDLYRLSGHSLKRATMSDILNGNRVKVPAWRVVQEFVTACRAAAAETGLDEDQLGTIADWNRHWTDVCNGVIGARFPSRDSSSYGSSGQVSGESGKSATVAETGKSPGETTVLPVHPEDSGGTGARPVLWGPVPPRLPDFVGRETFLAALRQVFTRDDQAGVVALQGMPGAGKTQLAIEYACRYAHQYDLVWWVPVDAVDDVLRRTEPFARWLLVLDGAGDPENLKSLIPSLPGDVLVTTRSTRWEAYGEIVEVDAFDRAESIEFLRNRMPQVPDVAAHRLADGVGDLPLLLAHAAESRLPVSAYLSRLNDGPLALLDSQPADYHSAIGGVWQAIVNQLRAEAPHAFDLLCCLAAFGPEPIPRDALERGGFLGDVSISELLRNPIQLAGAIRNLRRVGLLRISLEDRTLAVHQVTRYIVRDLTAGEGGEGFRHDVRLLLAAIDPRTPGDPTSWHRYAEIRRHAAASAAAACQHELVRELVVNLVRYLTASGDAPSASALADEAFAQWETDAREDDADVREGGASASGSWTLMRAAKADSLFARGEIGEAFGLWDEVVGEMRADPARWKAEILGIEGRMGARHRIAGDFAAALASDRDAILAHAAEFGHDDPRTFNAASSLIADLLLTGAAEEAADKARDLYRNCQAFYSGAGHPAVLAARNLLGRSRWLAGDYGEAAEIMAEVHRGYAASRLLEENHPWRLSHDTDYVIARRDRGIEPADLQSLADEAYHVRRRCWRALGVGHPQTLAASVVLGSILWRIEGRKDEAIRLLQDAERRYHSALPDHPHAHACSAYLAALQSDGESGEKSGIDFTPLPL